MDKSTVAVLGDRDSVMLWRALGVETVFVEKAFDAEKELHRLARNGLKIIYVTESIASLIPEAIDRYKAEPYPAVILIPSHQGTLGLGKQSIRSNVEKAIGADILFEEESHE